MELGKPKAFLADNALNQPPVLYFGTHKVELDEATALQWWWVLCTYFRNKELERERRCH